MIEHTSEHQGTLLVCVLCSGHTCRFDDEGRGVGGGRGLSSNITFHIVHFKLSHVNIKNFLLCQSSLGRPSGMCIRAIRNVCFKQIHRSH